MIIYSNLLNDADDFGKAIFRISWHFGPSNDITGHDGMHMLGYERRLFERVLISHRLFPASVLPTAFITS